MTIALVAAAFAGVTAYALGHRHGYRDGRADYREEITDGRF